MRLFNVKLKPQKCYFGYNEVTFVGHVFNEHGYHMSDERKQGIQDMAKPIDLKGMRSFLGMVNYFRDFIPNLSTVLAPLTSMTGKAAFIWSKEADIAFDEIKQLIWKSGTLTHLEDEGDIKLYTDSSKVGVGAMLTQVVLGSDGMPVERAILYLSHKFSVTASLWSTIEQECYAIFYAIITLQSYLLGRHFFVATDHRNLMYLEKSVVPKLVRWRLRLLEYDYTIIRIPGLTNVVADQLSRCLRMALIEGVEVDNIFKKFHNVIVGHHGVSKTCKMIVQANKQWYGYHKDVARLVRSCIVCQKIKNLPTPILNKNVYNLLGEVPMMELSVDSIGPLPEDENGNKFILVIVDNFSKFTELYATKSTTAISYVQAILQHMSIFGVMKSIRSDGGTQFTAHICDKLSKVLGYVHYVILPYHPQANGIVERKNAEVMKHLRALILVEKAKENWSMYLPIVQRILNATIDTNLDICPAELIFGNQLPIQAPFIVQNNTTENLDNAQDYVFQISKAMGEIVERSKKYLLDKIEHKQNIAAEVDGHLGHEFKVGDYVLVTYPTRAPHKLSPLYRGPMLIVEKVRDDIFKVKDLISGKIISFHVDRFKVFIKDVEAMEADLIPFAAADKDEFVVEQIVDHQGSIKKRNAMKFRIRWQGYDESEDTWLPWKEVKDLIALDNYILLTPDLIGL